MDSKVGKVLDLIETLCSNPGEKFKVAKIVLQTIAKDQGIHEDKLIPGGFAEQFVCEYFNLIWNKEEKNGIDAKTRDGKSVEIKYSNCLKKSNIMYDVGSLKSESKTNKCERIYTKYQTVACHIWFIDNNKQNGRHYIMILPGKHMAFLIYEILRNSTMDKKKINFGGTVCKTCNLIHRHAFLTNVFGVSKIMKGRDLSTLNSTVPVEEINWTEVVSYFTKKKTIESNRIDCEKYLIDLAKMCRK